MNNDKKVHKIKNDSGAGFAPGSFFVELRNSGAPLLYRINVPGVRPQNSTNYAIKLALRKFSTEKAETPNAVEGKSGLENSTLISCVWDGIAYSFT